MSINEKKVIHIFKTFIEKVFVPQLSKMEISAQQEWNKFSSMIGTDQFNFGQLQLYVDTLQAGSDLNRNKSPLFGNKIRKESTGNDVPAFNPSRTFGGQRGKMMFPLKDFEDPADKSGYSFNKDFAKEKDEKPTFSTQNLMPTLQKLFKVFTENQNKIQRVGSLPNSSPSIPHQQNYEKSKPYY